MHEYTEAYCPCQIWRSKTRYYCVTCRISLETSLQARRAFWSAAPPRLSCIGTRYICALAFSAAYRIQGPSSRPGWWQRQGLLCRLCRTSSQVTPDVLFSRDRARAGIHLHVPSIERSPRWDGSTCTLSSRGLWRPLLWCGSEEAWEPPTLGYALDLSCCSRSLRNMSGTGLSLLGARTADHPAGCDTRRRSCVGNALHQRSFSRSRKLERHRPLAAQCLHR